MKSWRNNPFQNINNIVKFEQLKIEGNGSKDKFKERRIVEMRTAKSIFDRDFKEIPENEDSVVKALRMINNNLKIFVHLLLNIRTNQVTIGKASGVKFENLQDKDDADKPEKE